MSRPTLDSFLRKGERRELIEPEGPPSPRQLAYLNRLGMLELTLPGHATPITKGEAAYAIRVALGEESET